jgi:quinohemoprotein ethanol dehydrogenase
VRSNVHTAPRLLALTAGVAFATAAAQDVSPPAGSPAFDGDALTAFPKSSWITNGGNVFNQRYSPLTEINRDTVRRLQPKWRTDLDDSGNASKYSGQGQPLVYAGIIYVSTGANDVFAVDVDTGQTLWAYAANLDPAIDVICCGWTSRGLALGDGRVYAGQLDGKLVALDQLDGRVLWSTQA